MKPSTPASLKLDASSASPAKNYEFITGLNKHSLPKFKHVDSKKRMPKGRLKNLMANIKERMEELRVSCGAEGFLVFYSPSLGMETWPNNRSEVLPLIHRFVESRNKLQQKIRGEGSEKEQQSLASLSATMMQEQGERAKIPALLRSICGNRNFDEMNLTEKREVIARTKLSIEAIKRKAADASALRGKDPKIEASPSEAAAMEDKCAKTEEELARIIGEGRE